MSLAVKRIIKIRGHLVINTVVAFILQVLIEVVALVTSVSVCPVTVETPVIVLSQRKAVWLGMG